VSKEITANMKEMGVILNGITDEASAKAAVPKIEALRAKMRDAGKRAKNVPKIDAATEKKIEETNEKAMGEAMESIGAAQQKLMAHPELLAIIEPAMQNMQDDL
jgi:surfactin synthase thioesterase subunit